jgi:hypothetical protein
MNTHHIRQCFARTFSVLLGAGLWGLLLDPMGGAITLSYADTPQPPSRAPSVVSKINRTLPGAHSGMLLMVKGNTVQISGVNYPLAPGVLIETVPPGVVIETYTGLLSPVSEGWEKHLQYPFPVQYWLGPGQTGITQMILSVPAAPSAPPRRK